MKNLFKANDMREIKFRAWHIDNKEMIYQGWNKTYFVTISNLFAYGGSVEFMQYTGLKDKNGKEIYEGDILNIVTYGSEEQKYIAKVQFDESRYIVRNKYGYAPLYDLPPHEVIGNIYENPELLK